MRNSPGPVRGESSFSPSMLPVLSESQQPWAQQALETSEGRGSFVLPWMCHSTRGIHTPHKYYPTSSRRGRSSFILINNLFDFCSRSTPCPVFSLTLHIFEAAFHFPSAGDQEFCVGELHSWIMRGCNHTPQRALNCLPSVLEAVQIAQEC